MGPVIFTQTCVFLEKQNSYIVTIAFGKNYKQILNLDKNRQENNFN